MSRCILIMMLVLAGPALSRAEIYAPPNNVKDPFKSAAGRRQVDPSLPFLYLEPHDACFDAAKPVAVTIYAVNRSGAAMSVNWRAVVEALALEAVGPGGAKPTGGPRFDSVQLKPNDFAKITLDLKDRFSITGGSVYRLTYARPLDDGRIHVADGVQLVVEDFAAIDKLANQLDAGAGRNTFLELLKHNIFFASGGMPKTFGWDAQEWHDRPDMLTTRWEEPLKTGDKLWRDGIARLTDHGGHPRAIEMLLDRLLALSDNFRGTPNQSLREYLDQHANSGLAAADRERVHLKLAATHDKAAVSRAVNRLMGMKSPAGLDAIIRVADGPDKQLAEEAISSLSNYTRNARVAQYLRKKMTDADPNLALEAAIVSCYAGDWSGFPIMLRAAKSDNADARLKAIAQFGDSIFRPYRNKIVPILLDELKSPKSNDHLERAIESLQTYPSQQVLDAVTPFLKHTDTLVQQRAALVVPAIRRELKGE